LEAAHDELVKGAVFDHAMPVEGVPAVLKFRSVLTASIIRPATTIYVAAMAVFPLAAAAEKAPSLGAMEAVSIAVDAYIYGYPLVTFDTIRKQHSLAAGIRWVMA
jgi:hypothetical protein